MKHLSKSLLGLLLLTGLQFGSSGCVSDGYASGEVYYGSHRDPWFRNDRWVDGHRWYRDEPRRSGGSVDVYISPPRIPRPPRVRFP